MLNRTEMLIVTALLIATTAGAASAQSTWAGVGRVEATVQGVINALARDLAAEALAPRARPWRLTVASPDSVRWHGVLDRVRTMLHGRMPEPTDRELRVLAIGERERTDSGSVYSVTVGRQWRCAGSNGRWVASEQSADIVVRRRSTYWEAVPDPHPVIGDPAPCSFGAPDRGRGTTSRGRAQA